MRKIYSRLISFLLIAFMIFGNGFAVFADELTGGELEGMSSATQIRFGEHEVVLTLEGGGVWYKITPSISAFYNIESSARDMAVYLYDGDGRYLASDPHYIDLHLTYYLEAGKTYYFYVSLDSTAYDIRQGAHIFNIRRTQSDYVLSFECDGLVEYNDGHCTFEVHPDLDKEGGYRIIPNFSLNDEDDYTYIWYVDNEAERVYEIESRTDSLTIDPYRDALGFIDVKKNGEIVYEHDFWVIRDNRFELDHLNVNVLAAPDTETMIEFPSVNCIDAEGVVYTYDRFDFDETSTTSRNVRYHGFPYTIQNEYRVKDAHGNEVTGGFVCFCAHGDNETTITSGTDLEVTLPFAREVMINTLLTTECIVYSFTPEVSGVYQIQSSDLQRGDPYVAVFDQAGNCISYNDDLTGEVYFLDKEYDCYSSDVVYISADYLPDELNFSLDQHFDAGATYKIVVWSSLAGNTDERYGPVQLEDYNYGARFKLSLNCIEPDPVAVTETPADPRPSAGVTTAPVSGTTPATGGSTGGQTPSGNPSSGTGGTSVNTPVPSTPTPAIPSATSAPVTETGVAGFVERLYSVALGRSSDPEGKQDWIDAITMRGETGASCARGFLYSPEFLNKDVSNEEFTAVLYRTFFNREPDQAGFNAWVGALNNGTPKEDVIEGFINSTEWANLCLFYGIRAGGTGAPSIEVEPNQATIEFATRLYTTCLCRQADQGGLMAWARQLANQRDTGTGAARGFFFSLEFTGQNVSDGEYVTRLYRTFMGREPDQAGFDAWTAQLDQGVSRETVFEGFAESPEFTRICASYGIIR